MRYRDRALWEAETARNQDPMGRAIAAAAERWADLMEQRLASGLSVADVARDAMFDSERGHSMLTGAMWGIACQVLGWTWIHGAALVAWGVQDGLIPAREKGS